MRALILVFLTFFIFGCGSGGSIDEDTTLKKIEDPLYKYQWYLHKDRQFYNAYYIDNEAHIHAGNYLRKYRGKGVKIAVIDNELDLYHNDLKGAVKETYSIFTKNSHLLSVEEIGGINEEHGTGVTGVIGARANDLDIFGVASESDIYFLQYSETMSDADTIELFKKAESFGADIINCSWGTENVSESVKEYIKELATKGRDGKGILIVFATGNNNESLKNDESMINEVISVGASNSENLKAEYSNYGRYLDILAPGGDGGEGFMAVAEKNILTLSVNNYAAHFSGTSFSAPIVSGALALMLEANPNLTREQAENILKSTADKIGDIPYNINGRNNYYGHGKINLSRAIRASLNLR